MKTGKRRCGSAGGFPIGPGSDNGGCMYQGTFNLPSTGIRWPEKWRQGGASFLSTHTGKGPCRHTLRALKAVKAEATKHLIPATLLPLLHSFPSPFGHPSFDGA